MSQTGSKTKLDKTQLEPFKETQGYDKKIEEFLTDEEIAQMKARTKLYFETLWKVMEK
jgi:hypothetical protein